MSSAPWMQYAQSQANGAKPWEKYSAPTAPAAPVPASLGSLVAQPQTRSNWWQNAGADLMHGGERTGVGHVLGEMQGRGDKGFTGLESGTSPETAEFMGSVPLGLAQVGKGTSEVTEGHPTSGLGNIVGGAAKAATIPSLVTGGPAAREVIEAIPSKAYAAHVLDEIATAAKDVPVDMEQTGPALGQFKDFVKTGGRNTPVMTKLASRITPKTPKVGMLQGMQNDLAGLQDIVPEQPPINFPEARQFYTNVSRATAKPGFLRRAIESPMMPDMRRNAGNVRQALNTDLTSAANSIGRGEDYANAIKEYRQGARLDKILNRGLKLGGAAVGEEALRRSGILGKLVSGAAQTMK